MGAVLRHLLAAGVVIAVDGESPLGWIVTSCLLVKIESPIEHHIKVR
jgi:hypothetical protein